MKRKDLGREQTGRSDLSARNSSKTEYNSFVFIGLQGFFWGFCAVFYTVIVNVRSIATGLCIVLLMYLLVKIVYLVPVSIRLMGVGHPWKKGNRLLLTTNLILSVFWNTPAKIKKLYCTVKSPGSRRGLTPFVELQ